MAEDVLPGFRLFVDSSVLIAGAVSSSGASFALMRVAEVRLVEARISAIVREEVLRNAVQKLPGILPALNLFLAHSVSEGPSASATEKRELKDHAHSKDLAILADAVHQGCSHLVTLNEKDFWPPVNLITVLRPGPLMQLLRATIHTLGR